MIPLPRINVQTASRERLIEHIDNLEMALADAYPPEGEGLRFQHAFGLTHTEALILAGLARRGRATREYLRSVSGKWGDKENLNVISVLMIRVRHKLEPFGIAIGSEWGVGYFIDLPNLQRLRAVMAERAAA